MIKFFSFFLFLVTSISVFGHSLSGVVVDENKGPLFGVTVINIASDEVVETDDLGVFELELVNPSDTLEFSYYGYQTKKIVIEGSEDSLYVILEPAVEYIPEIVISGDIDALSVISDVDVKLNPVNSSQDILRKVPGLFIGQHAGGGKAEQIFLRGFDIDHGTDITINVDGIPVNMVSHAHGQGYADLHFVIPETVEKIDYGKGPYYADKGNFNTAGFVDFQTKDRVDKSIIKAEVGQFNSNRFLGLFNLLNSNKSSAYIATEYLSTDGYFDSAQNFNRISVFGKYKTKIDDKTNLEFIGSHFRSRWDASGQVPERLIGNEISRFGAVDDTEGGITSRTNLQLQHHRYITDNSFIKSSVYFIDYDFELYSNFTFFLNDPVNGDQIRQRENRSVYGANTEYKHYFEKGKLDGNFSAGLSIRNDDIRDLELSRTANRTETISQLAFGDVNETNVGAYINGSFELGKWRINPGLRADVFEFRYNDELLPTFDTQSESRTTVSPKFNVFYTPTDKIQYFLKTGKGFHSNDTRVVVQRSTDEILPSAYGTDLGFIWKPIPGLLVNSALWYLFSEQEFVYVGDEAVVEPSGESQRYGIDFGARYQPKSWLFLNFDINYAVPRAIEEEDGQDFIPLAPDLTLVSGATVQFKSGIYGGLNLRFLKDRPANEDNSIVAEGYTVFDANAGYKWKNFDFSVQVQNLFDVDWNETQFAYESRLQNEAQGVEEIHFTPGTPFNARVVASYSF